MIQAPSSIFDDNRYSGDRGAHKNLKRAEKARVLAGNIPSIVENLTSKVKAWEMERGVPFLYDKASLLNVLAEYAQLRLEREEEKRRSREQKKLQDQLATEQEAIFGSRPATKKPLCQSNMIGTPIRRVSTPSGRHGTSGKERREITRPNIAAINYVALPKE
ncbi:hypothetical protein ACFE04_003249 [Oxalis oulophora]